MHGKWKRIIAVGDMHRNKIKIGKKKCAWGEFRLFDSRSLVLFFIFSALWPNSSSPFFSILFFFVLCVLQLYEAENL
ncbi:hypothetical protein Scep_026781 [Stephania cephalantha]|uniref:Uncharacterized protein n=1 Tax=Stephania cephalantha TaxID=152367 RepID=A0AAP0ER43_9MAGN